MSLSNGESPPIRPASFPYTLVIFAVVLYFALVVCAFGFISLLTDTDVVDQADAGPLVGPTATGAAILTVLLFLLSVARRYERDRLAAVAASSGDPVRIPLGRSIAIGFAAVVVYVLVGAALYSITTGEPFSFVLYVATSALRGYAIAVGVLATAVSAGYMLILASGGEHPARPLWPWER